MHKLVQFWKIKNNQARDYLSNILPESAARPYHTRHNLQRMPQHNNIHTNRYFSSFFPSVINAWNKIPTSTQQAASIHTFKSRLKENDSASPQFCGYAVGARWPNALHTSSNHILCRVYSQISIMRLCALIHSLVMIS